MLLFFVIFLVSFYVAVLCLYKLFILKAYILIIPIVATLFSAILFGYIFICNISNKMILNSEGIAITGQKIKGRIQHKDFISFCEIKNVKLICAHIDSKGKKLKIIDIASMRPHIFFEFELHNEKSKLIYIEIYSVRQRKKILETINRMTSLHFSYNNLENIDASMFRKKRKYNMNKKELILDCLIQDDETFTQIVEDLKLAAEIKTSSEEIKKLLNEMIDEEYISINYSLKNEYDEYSYSLTEKGKKAWECIKK